MKEKGKRETEIVVSKELAKRLQRVYPEWKVYANKCPSRGKKVRELWQRIFNGKCPPLQPEMDIVILDSSNHKRTKEKLRLMAVEIKYLRKEEGSIIQSFYEGLEQSLALLQWGFDNVALWQLYDESCFEDYVKNYGIRTWNYIRLLELPVDFTPFKLVGTDTKNMSFFRIRGNLLTNLIRGKEQIELSDIEDTDFPIKWNYPNPFLDEKKIKDRLTFNTKTGEKAEFTPAISRIKREVTTLRNFLINWLPEQRSGLDE